MYWQRLILARTPPRRRGGARIVGALAAMLALFALWLGSARPQAPLSGIFPAYLGVARICHAASAADPARVPSPARHDHPACALCPVCLAGTASTLGPPPSGAVVMVSRSLPARGGAGFPLQARAPPRAPPRTIRSRAPPVLV